MNTLFINTILFLSAIATGSGIGFLFGTLQNAALKRNKDLHKASKFKPEFNMMSGSLSRIAILLVFLALLQIIFPILFEGITQWIVSAGIVIGYGWTLLIRLRNRLADRV